MSVHGFLKVGSLLSPKIQILSKLMEPRKTTAQIPAAPPVYTNAQQKNFSNRKFIENLEFF
jgi:hypothetical protein